MCRIIAGVYLPAKVGLLHNKRCALIYVLHHKVLVPYPLEKYHNLT